MRRFEATLNDDERARAARFHFQKDRDHFVAGRGFLRALLGWYAGIAPEEVCFSYNSFGKPDLAADAGTPSLRFNLAHSHGLALCAVTRARQIGVDVERIRPDFATEEIAGKFFSPREAAKLRELPAELRATAFFDCWTRKEAFIKARGLGMSLPLDQFEVAFTPGESPAILHARDDPQAASRWTLRGLAPGEGYAGAVLVEGDEWKLECWDWA
jgi:4'-phosphopantetheinyl transferase